MSIEWGLWGCGLQVHHVAWTCFCSCHISVLVRYQSLALGSMAGDNACCLAPRGLAAKALALGASLCFVLGGCGGRVIMPCPCQPATHASSCWQPTYYTTGFACPACHLHAMTCTLVYIIVPATNSQNHKSKFPVVAELHQVNNCWTLLVAEEL